MKRLIFAARKEALQLKSNAFNSIRQNAQIAKDEDVIVNNSHKSIRPIDEDNFLLLNESDDNINKSVEEQDEFVKSNHDMSDNHSHCSLDVLSNISSNDEEADTVNDFESRLAATFKSTNMNNVQSKAVLRVIRTHSCFSKIPIDPRTILKSPSYSYPIVQLSEGEYLSRMQKSATYGPTTATKMQYGKQITNNIYQKQQSKDVTNGNCSEKKTTTQFQSSQNNIHRNVDIAAVLAELKSLNGRMKSLDERYERIEKKVDENNQLLIRISNKKRGLQRSIPSFLPFKTLQDLLPFNNCNEDMFDELVSYFIYLGGFNTTDCASTYFKHAFDIEEDISTSISWLGKSSSKKQALNKTKFADACEEAMKHNLNLKEQCHPKFVDGMTKALKSLKERRRRRSRNPVEEEEDNYEPNVYQHRRRQSTNDMEPDEESQKLKDEEQDFKEKLYEDTQQPQQQNDGNVMNEEQQWKNHSQQSLEQQESTTDADTLLDDSTNSDDHQFDYAEIDNHNPLSFDDEQDFHADSVTVHRESPPWRYNTLPKNH